MTTPFEEMASELMTRLEARREQAARLQRQVTEVAETATAAREAVRVTVGPQGELRGLEFPASAYKRLTPAELAEVIMKTYQQAREQASAAVRDLLGAAGHGGTDIASLLGAEAADDGEGLTVAGLRLPAEVTEYLRGGVPGGGQHG
jgi:DNA-binding protein YbaB